MKRLLLTTLITLGLAFPGAAMSATALTDTELAGVSGGGIDPHLGGQTLAQDQQQPNTNSVGYVPPREPRTNDGMDLDPELFAVLQSAIDSERTRSVALHGQTQQNAVAFNLENINSSDAVSLSNILEGSSLSIDDITTAVEVNQTNDLAQLHRTTGSLDTSVAGHRYERTVESSYGTQSYEYRSYSFVERHRRSEILREDITTSSAQVGGRYTSLDDFTSSELPLDIMPPHAFPKVLDLPPIGAIEDAGWFGEWGAEVDYTGMQLFGPGLRIDSISAGGTDGNDLLLGTRVELPKLDFGDIYIELCAGKCSQTHWDLKSVGGNYIYPNFTIADMAPEVEELNVGAGFDFYGNPNGEVLTATPGFFKVDGEVSLKVTPYATATLDLSKLELLGVKIEPAVKAADVFNNGTAIGKYTWSFDLIDKQFAFDLLDEEIKVPDIDLELGTPEHYSNEWVLALDNDVIEEYDSIDVAESSFGSSYEHSVLTGGQMTGAEAELLALSEGSLSVEDTSTVSLGDDAQRNMRVFNGVNSASSVAANALNIGRLPSFSAGPSGVPQTSVQQQNRFKQQL